MSSFRFGLGLGVSGGLSVFMVVNCDDFSALDGMSTSDWGIDLAFGPKWSGIASSLKATGAVRSLLEMGQQTRFGRYISAENLQNLRLGLSTVYNGTKAATSAGGAADVIGFDLPVGLGIEASASIKPGKMRVYSEKEGRDRQALWLKSGSNAGLVGTKNKDGSVNTTLGAHYKGGTVPY